MRLRSDPVMVERMKEAARRTASSPEFQAARLESYNGNRTWKRRVARVGRRTCQRINADPVLSAKRAEASAASVAGRVRRNAERLAAKAGIPVHLVETYRHLRWCKHYGQGEAVALLMRDHPGDFVPIVAAKRAAVLKAAGPMPAPGTSDRIAWSQTLNASLAALEARPC